MHDRATNNDKSFSPDVLLHPDPLCKPSQIQQNINKINKINQNTDVPEHKLISQHVDAGQLNIPPQQ